MSDSTIREAETVTRSVAKWGSIAAALVFGVTFVSDSSLYWEFVSDQAVQIALVIAIFSGYAIAWTKRFEVHGSVLALLAIAGIYLNSLSSIVAAPSPVFLAIGAPALFHLIAVVLHRFVLPAKKHT